MVQIPGIRVGKRQTIESLTNEKALLLAQFIRDEGRLGLTEWRLWRAEECLKTHAKHWRA
jgi:hypothetical protein